jgi:hypothetical protein
MKIEVEKRSDSSIDICHFDAQGRRKGCFLASSKNSALLVVDALLDGIDPPRDYRKATAQKIQKLPRQAGVETVNELQAHKYLLEAGHLEKRDGPADKEQADVYRAKARLLTDKNQCLDRT